MTIECSIVKDEKTREDILVVKIPVNDPPVLSSTGKTLLVASSNGYQASGIERDGKPVKVSVMAYIKK